MTLFLQRFIKKKGYPNYTQVMRVVEGGETPLFKSFFSNWVTSADQLAMGIMDKSNIGRLFFPTRG